MLYLEFFLNEHQNNEDRLGLIYIKTSKTSKQLQFYFCLYEEAQVNFNHMKKYK